MSDTLQKFREAREDAIRDMGVGTPLGSADSSRQVVRLRELHEVCEIMKVAVAEAAEVHAGREQREAKPAPELRRASLLHSAPLPDAPFRPL